MAQARSIAHAVHLDDILETPVSMLSHGQQRQLEIALALSGAPRFILFDEPAAGLSPAERRDLVEILNALPAHIGYIIIEHDLDVALRVSTYVTMMHNGRIFKEGAPRRSRTTKRFRPSISGRGMAERRSSSRREGKPILQVQDLQVYYGESHALQGVSLSLERGILSVVGRNGMGKTTLCNTIVGLMRARSGAIRFEGRDISKLEPHRDRARRRRLRAAGAPPLAEPDGRRNLAPLFRAGAGGNSWTVERVYATFPRLAERKSNGGGQLSGGEQQMLAISRALLGNPRLLIMDEPTEGLAPVIVAQVRDLLIRLASEEDLSVLVVEQNIGVATSVSDRVAIMVNGRVNRIMEAGELARDRDLQQRLLGVGRHGDAQTDAAPAAVAPRRRRASGPDLSASRARAPMRTTARPNRSTAPSSLPNRWGVRTGLGEPARGPPRAGAQRRARSSPSRSPSASAAPRWWSARSTPRAPNSATSAIACAP